ncbi:probable ATP-dependent RNA helicase DHX37 [Centruroides sculpturatus]|uniref:probable ATP-dependent RNA helicase DHX37 n=1 Tax=Centruroides sculpturatus TaxID=218467 RepID=UPI000C6D8BE7|nr:probable ATP-dependent RNA helicase DHX37 [Centruroides sculpturatus]
MGKSRKYNWKARQQQSEQLKVPKNEVKLNLDIPIDTSKYDESNTFALPSKKEKSEKIKNKPTVFHKSLSKKERKRIAQKQRRHMKRLQRNELLEDLQKVQISNEELKLMTSITDFQTKGRRRFLKDAKVVNKASIETVTEDNEELTNIIGIDKKRKNCYEIENESIESDEEASKLLKIDSVSNSENGVIKSLEDNTEENFLDSISEQNIIENNTSNVQNYLNIIEEDRRSENNSFIQEFEEFKSRLKPKPTVYYPKPTLYERKILKKNLRKQMKLKKKKQSEVGEYIKNFENMSSMEYESINDESIMEKEKTKALEEKSSDINLSNENINHKEAINSRESKLNLDKMKTLKENDLDQTNIKSEEKLEVQKTNKGESKQQFILINRTSEIQNARLALPILPEEHVIMEALSENHVVIICGQTGCGKTTQVPQFLYEARYANDRGIIGITQPRRIAATSLAERVAYEMNLSNKIVSYQIRFEGNVTEETKIKFMTDGILLKEIQKDFLLTKYNVIVIDEAHERSMHSDLLIGLLSGVVRLRAKKGNPLKMIIMSATLRIQDFVENKSLFEKPPPVIKIDARQYPVTIHFNRRTPTEDYIETAYKKVCRIHQELPEGGILVFVTGREEVHRLCRKLQKTFPCPEDSKNDNVKEIKTEEELDKFMDDPKTLKKIGKHCSYSKQNSKLDLPDIDLDKYSIQPMDEEMLLEQAESEEEDIFDDEFENTMDCKRSSQPMLVLPLYSLLPIHKQSQVFQAPPEGTRLCVVATNVAETSLTIPNIKYVVDTGKIKRRIFDKKCGISTFIVTWTSQASANQRAGRAGRTGSGHCYRLYSSSVFTNEFPKFSPPEITLRPIDDIVLYMKVIIRYHIQKSGYKITQLGRIITHFSVNPRFGKMIACSFKNDVMPYTIIIVSALSVREIFLDSYMSTEIEGGDDDEICLYIGPLCNSGSQCTTSSNYSLTSYQPTSFSLLAVKTAIAAIICRAYLYSLSPLLVHKELSQVVIAVHNAGLYNIQVQASEERLMQLGALEKETRKVNGLEKSGYKITQLGRIITHFSVNPRFGKMIACSFKNDVMPYTIIIVSALSVREIFLDSYMSTEIEGGDDDENNKSIENKKWKSLRMQWAELECAHGLGDIMVLLKAVGGTENVGLSRKVCDDNGLRYKALLEIRKLRCQLTKEVNLLSSKYNYCMDPKLDVPTASQKEYLCRLILATGINHVAKKIPINEIKKENRKKFKNAYQASEERLMQLGALEKETRKVNGLVISAIDPSWIPLVAPQLCSFSKPLEKPPPRYDAESDEILCHMTSTFGQQQWELPPVELKFPVTTSRYSWFGRFFLEGEIIPALKKYSKFLIISPTNMIKDWARFQERTQYVLNCLINKQVDSKKALLEEWKKDSKYLLWAYCQWLPAELHSEISQIWPPSS